MEACKCDICKKLFEAPMCTPDITIRRYRHPYGEDTLDLCPECQKRLEKWIESGGKINVPN